MTQGINNIAMLSRRQILIAAITAPLACVVPVPRMWSERMEGKFWRVFTAQDFPVSIWMIGDSFAMVCSEEPFPFNSEIVFSIDHAKALAEKMRLDLIHTQP